MRFEILIIAAVVIVSGCLHAGNEAETSQPQEPVDDTLPSNLTEESNIVYLTDSGFRPSTLTIEQGETVTWLNSASQEMWVASDRHPTHTDYDGSTLNEHCQNGDQNTAAFDQCSAGDRFSFTFEKTGEWGYHNHENAGQTGKIIVE